MRAQFLLAALALGAYAQQQDITQGQGQDITQGQGQDITQQGQGQDITGQGQDQGQGQIQQQQQGSAATSAAGQQPGAVQSGQPGSAQTQTAASGAQSNAPQVTSSPAPVINNNPVGVIWTANFPEKNSSSIKGYVSGTANVNGTGVVWSVNIQNLPANLGPFLYHVHESPVPSDGNCTGAGAHLDPEGRGEKPPCDPTQGLASCQVGDLSGKHGNITTDPFQIFYMDRYFSTTKGNAAFMGNRSIVIHDKFANRLTCANLTRVDTAATTGGSGSNSTSCSGGSGSGSSSGSGSGSNSTAPSAAQPTQQKAQPSSSSSPHTGAAAHMTQSVTAVLGIAAFVALAL